MKFGIFSDVHSNLEALNRVIRCLENEKVDKYICLGDLIGYGPDPALCIKKIKSLNAIVVAGNHDWALLNKISLLKFNKYAAESIEWTRDKLNKNDLSYISTLKLKYFDKYLCAVHSAYNSPNLFKYVYNREDIFSEFKYLKKRLCFIGHTHIPFIYEIKSRKNIIKHELRVKIEPNKKYIINVGSVGQPRDGDFRACFCLYDTKKKLVELRRISYNIDSVKTKMRNIGLAEFLANRLGQGR